MENNMTYMTPQTAAPMAPMMTNGVNVTALGETINAIGQNTDIANFQFQVRNQWMGGDHNRTTIEGFFGACERHSHTMGPFIMDNAEPPVLLGEGVAPNPVEYVLHALAGCLTTSMVYHAAARGIEVSDVSSEIEGDLDLRGFLGMSDEVRKGFHTIRVKIRVKTDATAETMSELTKFSPVYEMISRSLPVEIVMETC